MNFHFDQIGGGACKLCGAEKTNSINCPLNPKAKNPNFAKHNVAAKTNPEVQPKKSPVKKVKAAAVPKGVDGPMEYCDCLTAKGLKCRNKKKFGDFCSIHKDCKQIWQRIATPPAALAPRPPPAPRPPRILLAEQEERPKLIGSGTYGCVYKPPLKCIGPGERQPCANCITKIMEDHAMIEEYSVYETLNLNEIDPEGKYYIPKPSKCTIDPNFNISECDILETNPGTALTYENGGVNMVSVIQNMSKDNINGILRNFANIIEGVVALNSNNIFHIDIKPENIVCGENGTGPYKLIDFGLTIKGKVTADAMYESAYIVWPIEVPILIGNYPRDDRLQDYVKSHKKKFMSNINKYELLSNFIGLNEYDDKGLVELIRKVKNKECGVRQPLLKWDPYGIGYTLFMVLLNCFKKGLDREFRALSDLLLKTRILDLDYNKRMDSRRLYEEYMEMLHRLNID